MAKEPVPVTPERIGRAMRALRPAEREALRLSAGEGLSHDQIACRLGIPAEAVASLIASALVRLDRALARQERPWWRFW